MARSREPDKVETLRRVPLFAGLDEKHLTSIAGLTTEMHFNAGSILAEEGALGREAVVLLVGEAAVTRGGEKVTDIGPGEVVGEMSLINHAPRSATVTATSDCTALVMDSREFSSILEDNPDVAIRVLKTVVSRLVELQRPG